MATRKWLCFFRNFSIQITSEKNENQFVYFRFTPIISDIFRISQQLFYDSLIAQLLTNVIYYVTLRITEISMLFILFLDTTYFNNLYKQVYEEIKILPVSQIFSDKQNNLFIIFLLMHWMWGKKNSGFD